MALFQRRAVEEEPENRDRRTGYVPASMRERPAPAVMSAEDFEDGHDEEMEFLSNLAGEVDSAPERTPSPQPGTGPLAQPSEDDEMWAFRGYDAPVEANESVRRYVPDVEITDLLDELKVTAAAMRRRRAA